MIRTEKISLKWEDFQENVTSAFGTLKESGDFVDVTLVCEDGQLVKAHRVILASTSPYFMSILGKSIHPQPLIYMRGVLFEDLVGIVDFLYSGETSVLQENLNRFLTLAQELKLKGLSGKDEDEEEGDGEEGEEEVEGEIHKKDKYDGQVLVKKESKKECKVQKNKPSADPNEATDGIDSVFVDPEGLAEKVNSFIATSEKRLGESYRNEKASVCNVCGKEGSKSNIKGHIEAKHIIGTRHTCNFCSKMIKTRDGLRTHVKKLHSGING